jgi:hypothetical protein
LERSIILAGVAVDVDDAVWSLRVLVLLFSEYNDLAVDDSGMALAKVVCCLYELFLPFTSAPREGLRGVYHSEDEQWLAVQLEWREVVVLVGGSGGCVIVYDTAFGGGVRCKEYVLFVEMRGEVCETYCRCVRL